MQEFPKVLNNGRAEKLMEEKRKHTAEEDGGGAKDVGRGVIIKMVVISPNKPNTRYFTPIANISPQLSSDG